MEDLSAELKEKTRNILPRNAKYTLIGLMKFYCVIHASNLQDYTENNNPVSQDHLKCLYPKFTLNAARQGSQNTIPQERNIFKIIF